MSSDSALLTEIRDELHAAADAERAPQMQSYMKSAMPYLGVPVPLTRRIARLPSGRGHRPIGALIANVRALWQGAEFREERYAATALLDTVIAANLADREFFIRKAIGWGLREYARTDPDWVRRYVDAHELSGLSRREALKHL